MIGSTYPERNVNDPKWFQNKSVNNHTCAYPLAQKDKKKKKDTAVFLKRVKILSSYRTALDELNKKDHYDC